MKNCALLNHTCCHVWPAEFGQLMSSHVSQSHPASVPAQQKEQAPTEHLRPCPPPQLTHRSGHPNVAPFRWGLCAHHLARASSRQGPTLGGLPPGSLGRCGGGGGESNWGLGILGVAHCWGILPRLVFCLLSILQPLGILLVGLNYHFARGTTALSVRRAKARSTNTHTPTKQFFPGSKTS